MTLQELRQELESFRRSVDEEARALKDSYFALEKLQDLYRGFNPEKRAMADHVLAEWALSEEEGLRFDALALIEEFKVKRAITALGALAKRLASSDEPGAPYELQKVDRIVKELGGDPHSGHA